MKNDFKPAVDHRFQLRGDWGSVDCRVLVVEPNKSLSYTVGRDGPRERGRPGRSRRSGAGTLLRMEQAGFRPDQQQAYQGCQVRLAEVLRQPRAGGGEGVTLRRARHSVRVMLIGPRSSSSAMIRCGPRSLR